MSHGSSTTRCSDAEVAYSTSADVLSLPFSSLSVERRKDIQHTIRHYDNCL